MSRPTTGQSMRRRDFLGVVSGVAVTWPLAGRAQQAGKIPRVGYLWHAANAEEEGPYYKALLEGLRDTATSPAVMSFLSIGFQTRIQNVLGVWPLNSSL